MGIEPGTTVRVHYRGTLQDGTEFDSSRERGPLEFTLGEGMVIPGFDSAVAGLTVGESVTVTIPPSEAYGDRFEDAVHSVPLERFYEPPNVDDRVTVLSPEGEELLARVTIVGEDEATLDFNHPLAGETLVFEIELVEVVAPS